LLSREKHLETPGSPPWASKLLTFKFRFFNILLAFHGLETDSYKCCLSLSSPAQLF
jgi:hypothetical protein